MSRGALRVAERLQVVRDAARFEADQAVHAREYATAEYCSGFFRPSKLAPKPPIERPAGERVVATRRQRKELARLRHELVAYEVPVGEPVLLVDVKAPVHVRHHDREPKGRDVSFDRGATEPDGLVVAEAAQQEQGRVNRRPPTERSRGGRSGGSLPPAR